MAAHFQIPLDLPHAGKIAWRLETLLAQLDGDDGSRAVRPLAIVGELRALLDPYHQSGENPLDEEAPPIVKRSAELGRALADEIERQRLGFDRLGQCVRNLFECLELGEEGASISLRAGENPASALRPR